MHASYLPHHVKNTRMWICAPVKGSLMVFIETGAPAWLENQSSSSSSRRRKGGEEIFFLLFLDCTWAAGDVIWNPCWLNCTPWSYPPTLIQLPPSSLSLIVVARVSIKKLAALLQLMVDKPSRPGLTWTRLLFIPSPPVPLTSTTAQFLLAGLNLYP